jgi:hypothetical protein
VIGARGITQQMTPLDIAISYIARGWNPLPIPHRTKKPTGNEWQRRVIDTTTAPRYFDDEIVNIGIVLGPSSNGLTDVDLDCAEAIAIAPYILPQTKAIFGRPSKRNSHWLYKTALAAAFDGAAIQLHDPTNKSMLIELRIGGGGKGAQTVFPGSTHKDGEAISWEQDGEPSAVNGEDLRKCVQAVAAYSLLARYWPKVQGSRHGHALLLGGFLARCGRNPKQAGLITTAIARAAGDEEWRDRAAAAESAATGFQNGERAYGVPSLIEGFGKPVAERVIEWLEYRGSTAEGSADQAGDQAKPADPVTESLDVRKASSFEINEIEWLWPDRFARGELGIIGGMPDEGKSQVLIDIIARVTTGASWPFGEGTAPQGNAILLMVEDDPNHTTVPRLMSAGADLERVHIVQAVTRKDGKGKRIFSYLTDLGLLRQKIEEIGDVQLLAIVPVSAYFGAGKVDTYRNTDVRAVLNPLINLAHEYRLSIIGLLHFNKKIDVTHVLARLSGSSALSEVPRHVYAAVNDEENQRKILVKGKNNIARPGVKALAYGFSARKVGVAANTGNEVWAPHVAWLERVDVNAADAMAAANGARAPGARSKAEDFLRGYLEAGPMPAKAVYEAAEANGISKRTLERAKDKLEISTTKDGPPAEKGGPATWMWRLP